MGASTVLEDGTEVKTPDNIMIEIDPIDKSSKKNEFDMEK